MWAHHLLIAAVALLALSLGSPDARATSVMVIGDSNIHGALGIALESDIEAMGIPVTRYGVVGSGLARPDYFDWSLTTVGLVGMYEPDLVLLMFGANDTQFIAHDEGNIAWADETRWSAEYTRRLVGLVTQIQGRGRRVVLLGPTNRRSLAQVERLARIRALQREVAASRPDVGWIDLFPLSTDDEGRYLNKGFDVFGHEVRMRMRDGRHLTRVGGTEVARRLLVVLDARGILRAAPQGGQSSGRGALTGVIRLALPR